METVTRFVVTLIGRDGLRVLMGPAQGRCTYATSEAAQSHLDAVFANNNADRLASVFGHHDLKPEVRACECWPVHFDPCGIYFD